ncbi:hypothetical protein BKI52_12820 [marine bacterium AO1-C]|nr:hypothetical protein BKI52_12820 [marine bacterium AO1-C]
MLKNYLKIAFRNLLRNKLFSALNIMGLVIGMVACLLILQYVRFETSYDSFFKNADNIYRISNDDYQEGRLAQKSATSYINLGRVMINDFPEVQKQTTIRRFRVSTVAYKQKRFKQKDLYLVDPSFFEVFSLHLLKGNPKTALSKPLSIVLTQTMAQKYFGRENPMGKTLVFDGRRNFKVTGIVEDAPANSHLKFSCLISNHRLRKVYKERKFEWAWSNFHVYVVTKPGTTKAQLQAKLPAINKKYLDPVDAETVKFQAHKLTDIHLLSGYDVSLTPGNNANSIYLLLLIAVFILLIAWINYINLATARATDRAREVGIRKVIGAYRRQLIVQFLGESFLINLLAVLLTVFLVDFLSPLFVQLTGKDIQFNMWQSTEFWLIFGAIFISGVVLSGLYPAFVLSGFKPVTVLKGKIIRSPQGIVLRKGLTLFQFAASFLLIGGTLAVYQQLSHMRSKEVGFKIDKTLIVEGPRILDSTFGTRIKAFMNNTRQLSQVQSLTTSSCIPGQKFSANISGIKVKGQPGDGFLQNLAWVDAQYIPAYGLKLLAGRNFSAKNKADYQKSVILNASAVKMLGYKPQDIINKKLICEIDEGIDTYTIVGVIDDYHQKSFKEAVGPLVLHYRPITREYFSIKLHTSDMPAAIAAVKGLYTKSYPKDTFEYYFLDVAYNAQYKADQRFGEMFALFSGLAIFVACMGLFGLASFTLLQRTKEVGIRKVLGASGQSLMILLLRDFLKPVMLASLLALPIMYWGITEWLKNFAYRMAVDWVLFVLPLLVVGIIALLTVGFQTLKATRNNPIDSLRYE